MIIDLYLLRLAVRQAFTSFSTVSALLNLNLKIGFLGLARLGGFDFNGLSRCASSGW